METTDPNIVYQGGLMLAGKMQTMDGDQICFWLDGDYETHPFERYRFDRSGPSHGAQFMAVIVEINDQGEVIDQIQRQRIEDIQKGERPVTPGKADIQICAICCKDKKFHAFLETEIHRLGEPAKRDMAYSLPHRLFKKGYAALQGPFAEDFSRHYVYWWCGVTSRAQLGFKPKATKKWRCLEQRFYKWRIENE